MRAIRFILMCAGLAGIVTQPTAAQTAPDLEVRVLSGGQPVGYSYVLINDTFHAMTDSVGTTRIPVRKLGRGDTLSARHVGMESVPVVWNGSAPAGSVIGLELIPNTIGEVVVTARDRSKQLFRKYVKKIPATALFMEYKGDYNIRFPDSRLAQGKYNWIDIPKGYADYRNVNTFTLQPASDTTGLSRRIAATTLSARGVAFQAAAVNDLYDSTEGMVVKYRGKDNGHHLFLIIKPYFDDRFGSGDSFQALIEVDPDGRQIVSAEVVKQESGRIWNMSANYALHKYKKSNTNILYATRMEGTINGADSRGKSVSTAFLIDNVTAGDFSLGPIPHKDRKQNQR